jgi:hypothetical protein
MKVPYINGKIRKGVWAIFIVMTLLFIGEGLGHDDDVTQLYIIIFVILLSLTLWYQYKLYTDYLVGWLAWLLKDDRTKESSEPQTPLTLNYPEPKSTITNITLNDSVWVGDKE